MEENNRGEFLVPEEDLVIITIEGFKFFRGNNNTFQCTTCLNMMGTQAAEKHEVAIKERRIRKIKIIKDCNCAPQK